MDRETVKKDIEKYADFLTFRELIILRSRFGLEGKPKTLEEIGKLLGTTRQRINQIEGMALKKIENAKIKFETK